MLHCPNKNSTLYKLLKQLNGGSEGLATHYYDEVNRLQDLGVISSKRFEAKESGKMYYSIPKIITEKSVSDNMKGKKNGVFTKDEAAFVELERQLIERDIDWIKITETPKAYRVELLPGVKTDAVGQTKMFQELSPEEDKGEYYSKEYRANDAKISEADFREIADKLKAKTGVDYEIVTPEEAIQLLKEMGADIQTFNVSNVPAFYKNNMVIIPNNYMTSEVAFHEFGHAFVDAITSQNKALFISLKKNLQDTESGKEIIKEIKSAYKELVDKQGELTEKGWKEAITTALGRLADNQLSESKDKGLIAALKRMLTKIGEYLQSLFSDKNKTIEPFELKATTTLGELATMLNLDNKINVGKPAILFEEAKKMEIYGITSNQKSNIPFINQMLYRSIVPATYYSDKILKKAIFSLFVGRDFTDFKKTIDSWLDEEASKGSFIPDWARNITEEQYKKREDAWRLSNGLKQVHNTFKYIGRNDKNQDVYDFINPVFNEVDLAEKRDITNNVMGKFYLNIGKDDIGYYLEYSDVWDLDLTNKFFQSIVNATQKPFEVKGKIYHATTYDENGKIINYYTPDVNNPDIKHYQALLDELNSGSSIEDIQLSKREFNKVEEEELPKNELSELTDKIKLFLNKKLAILERRNIKNKKYKENQLKRVIDTIKELEGVETINTFVEDAYSQIKLAEKQFDNLIKNKDSFSNKEMIDSLSTFNDFVSGYSILDEISEADIEEYFSNPEKGLKEQESFSVQDKLSYAIMAREKIKQRYLKQGIPLLADYLLGYKSKELTSQIKREIEQIQKKIAYVQNNSSNSEKRDKQINILEKRIAELEGFDLTKESLIKQLKSASADEGAIDYLFSPLISSEDSVIALFAKSVKDQLENSRIKSIEFAKKADKEFNDFAEKSGKSKDNVSKFNEGIYEEIEVPVGKDANGDTIFAKKLAFVQKYDVTSFEKNKSKFFKSIGPKPIITEESTKEEKAALKEWNKAVGKWFSENTQAKSVEDIKEIIKQKDEELEKGIITKEEYDQWTKRVISTYEGVDTYKYELAEPSSKYINKKYTDLEGTAQGDYYNFLLESYLNSQKRLPENFRKGYILPSIEKEDLDRASERGIVDLVKNKAKESVQRQDYDTEYGLAGLNEKDAKYLPVFFTQNMDAGQVSKDLISSIMRFDAMSLRYEALNNISGETALIKQVVSKRDTIKTNSKGEKVLDAFAKKMGYEEYIKNSGESYSEKHLTAFIDMIIYGELQKEETIFGLDAGKITNTLTGFSAITTIAMDLMKGVSNNIQGNIQSMIEANSGEYFTKTDLAKGKLFYAKSVPDFLSDFNQISPKTLPSQLVELYDAMQGQFKDEYGRAVSGSVAKKLFRTNTLFFNQNIGEHEIQVSMLFSILNSEKVKNKKNGEELSVLEAYQEFGIDGLLENTDFTEEKRKDIQNNLHALNKRLNGVYNEFDKGTAQRYSLGRLAIMYRKHLIPGYKRRFKKLSADQELGGITEGYYRTFWNTFAKDLGQLKFNIANNWSSYTDFEKAQIKRTLAEAVIILMLSSAVMVLKSLGDDDDELKKNWAYNFLLYQAVRLRSETSSYISPLDAYRVVKSPSAMTSTAERAIKFTNQLLFTWDPEKLKYKKKTGVWKKGDNKSWANFLKLMGYSGYNITPEEAVKSFEMSVNK